MKTQELKIKDPKVKAKVFKLIEDMDKINMGDFRRQIKKATDTDLKKMIGMVDEELKKRGINSF